MKYVGILLGIGAVLLVLVGTGAAGLWWMSRSGTTSEPEPEPSPSVEASVEPSVEPTVEATITPEETPQDSNVDTNIDEPSNPTVNTPPTQTAPQKGTAPTKKVPPPKTPTKKADKTVNPPTPKPPTRPRRKIRVYCRERGKIMRKILSGFMAVCFLAACFGIFTTDAAAQKPNKRARNLAKQGDQLYNRNRFQEALQKYNEAVKISPVFPKVRFYKGYAHLKLGQVTDSIKELDMAESQGYSELEVVSIRMEAHFQNADYEAAYKDASSAVRLQPKTAYYHTFLGRIDILKGDFEGAVEAINKSIELGEKGADTYYFLAIAYGGMGNFEEQGKAAQVALSRGLANAGGAWYLVGDAKLRAKQYQDATDAFTNSANAYKNDLETGRGTADTETALYETYVDLADAYRNLNRFDDAITAAKSGLSIRPNDGSLHTSLAWYYSLSGEIASAIAAGQKAVELDGKRYMAHTNLCRAYIDQGEYFYKLDQMPTAKTNFNSAVTSCKRALQIETNDGETNYYLGRAYYYLDNSSLSDAYYKKSVPGLEKFAADNPSYSDAFYLLGNAYFATKQNSKAIDTYLACLKISPQFARVRYNLGYVYTQTGKKDLAKIQYDMLVSMDKELAERLLGFINAK